MSELYKKLIEYSNEDYYAFHMPGHKRNPDFAENESPYKYDITEIDGFDNLHHAEGILKEEMERAAKVFGAARTYFLINGSTCGILSAISAVSEQKKKIIIARNSHKSVYNAVFLNSLEPVYLYPQLINLQGKKTEERKMCERKEKEGPDGECSAERTDICINGSYNIEDARKVIENNKDACAVVITSPTYEGVVSDIKAISNAAHEFNIPLIVDQAHGAHFGMHKDFPESAVALGADIVISSLHKTLMSLTQTAVLHVNGNIADYKKVEKYLGIYQTSSPSYVLLSSIADCVETLSGQSEEMFDEYVQRIKKFKEGCENLNNLYVFSPCDKVGKDIYDFDIGKLVICINNNLITGQQLYDRLLNVYHLQMEMAAENYVLAMTSPADTDRGFMRLQIALHEIDEWLEKKEYEEASEEKKSENSGEVLKDKKSENSEEILEKKKFYKKESSRQEKKDGDMKSGNSRPDIVMTPRKAMLRETKKVDINCSVGEISGEYIYLYPPGIPLIVPGERITKELIIDINRYKAQGLNVQGTEDPGVREIKVII